MSSFLRVPIVEPDKKRATGHRLTGFAYHYGTKKNHMDTGIREQTTVAPRYKRGERVYRDLEEALKDWKAEHG